MVNSVPVTILAGIVLGMLSGLGVGGGSLLMLWLTLVMQMPYEAARTVNLLFFLPSAIIASLFYRKQGVLQYKKVLPAIIAAAAGAALCSLLRQRLDAQWLQRLFGILLLITGVRELCYRPRKPK